jgi:hypothetical protein
MGAKLPNTDGSRAGDFKQNPWKAELWNEASHGNIATDICTYVYTALQKMHSTDWGKLADNCNRGPSLLPFFFADGARCLPPLLPLSA